MLRASLRMVRGCSPFVCTAFVLTTVLQFLAPVAANPIGVAPLAGKSCTVTATPYELKIPFGLEDEIKAYIPAENPLTVEKVELGKLLFFDPRLSMDNTISCASCHKPELAWTDGTKLSMGISNQLSTRNSMTVVNRLYGRAQLWHGKMSTLEDQAKNPLTKAVRMGMISSDTEVAKLNSIKGYRDRFQQVFCSDVTMDGIAKAIAAFERTILSGNSPADRFDMGGEVNALSESARRGLTLFQGKGRCTRCHSGFNFSDEEFHNLGIDWDKGRADLGRYSVDQHPGTVGGFKTPTLREIARTAPYMHDGRFATLEEVVEFYDRGGIVNPHLSNLIIPLGLTDQEKKDLVEYMKALNGEGWQMTAPDSFPE
ncbi:Cytochrome c551 peroxidase [Nitrospira sp. KM1]|uniref:cytochrome-c peroxidase n=1 Tax=Nitrospira sp. KM1 TaxID=1936990 RepID=UPI0013A71459|nr:cytochrome c peroxidase [Nitrospira sp. KM1]BCA53457.1 Cytochrome c551 peroxidase [Nitrospira sp. KM1]